MSKQKKKIHSNKNQYIHHYAQNLKKKIKRKITRIKLYLTNIVEICPRLFFAVKGFVHKKYKLNVYNILLYKN